jgi:hypothetical protein
MIGTDLKVVSPAQTEVLGPDVNRLATLHTNARTDRELLKVLLKSHADGSLQTAPTGASASASLPPWRPLTSVAPPSPDSGALTSGVKAPLAMINS